MEDKNIEGAIQELKNTIRFLSTPSVREYYINTAKKLGAYQAIDEIKNLNCIAKSHVNAVKASQSRRYD